APLGEISTRKWRAVNNPPFRRSSPTGGTLSHRTLSPLGGIPHLIFTCFQRPLALKNLVLISVIPLGFPRRLGSSKLLVGNVSPPELLAHVFPVRGDVFIHG